ncbi:hypothetical protein [Carboxylicivirga sp. RSCT41]|uniref:hypothetical protein n=1 Tax=Carboxylicivirga agarovorans TaxID=3417570 RepID=UPI003D33E189
MNEVKSKNQVKKVFSDLLYRLVSRELSDFYPSSVENKKRFIDESLHYFPNAKVNSDILDLFLPEKKDQEKSVYEQVYILQYIWTQFNPNFLEGYEAIGRSLEQCDLMPPNGEASDTICAVFFNMVERALKTKEGKDILTLLK